MSLEKSNISWSAKQLSKMVSSGKINFDHIVQRSYVWETSRKSALIESMILGYPIPAVFAKRIEGEDTKIYYIMDGKQRLSTIADFIQDKFKLTALSPVKYSDDDGNDCEKNISGMKFSELPEELKDALSSVMLSVVYFDNLTQNEEIELFKRLNAGKSLSTKARIISSCNNVSSIMDVKKNHTIFEKIMSAKAIQNKDYISFIMKIYAMINNPIEKISFDTRSFTDFIEKTHIKESGFQFIDTVLNYMEDIYDSLNENGWKIVSKKIRKETNFISVVPFVVKAINQRIDYDIFLDWIHEFFGTELGVSISENYNAACESGTSKNTNIVERHKELEKSFNEFFQPVF